MMRKLVASAFVLGLMAAPLHAAEKISTPVEVEANEMEIIDADKQAVFRGKVDAVRGDQHIRSDIMTVFYAEVKQPDGTSKSQASKLDATGNVIIERDQDTTHSKRAIYSVDTGSIRLEGNPEITLNQGGRGLADLSLNNGHTG